jgi:uncharacterized protein (TIGR01777 family)
VRVAVTGATGTIGQALVHALRERGDEVTALSRDAERASASLGVPAERWAEPTREPPPAAALSGRDAVVHLLGETIAQRWSDEAKREIRDSRVLGTRNLVTALRDLPDAEGPRVLVSQSGAGVYGARGDEPLDETAPAGDDFVARMVVDWEAEASAAAELGVRVVMTRTGPVLSEGGALGKMLPFFKAGIGGPVAGGRQYLPWVHLDDMVGAVLFALDTPELSGPVNLTAPDPATNKQFSRTLGRVLHRPAFAPVPALALKALYGEMAFIVTTGQRAVPKRLLDADYAFRRPDLEQALREVTRRRTP